MGLSGSPWKVFFKLPDFKVEFDGVKPDGRRYFFASDLQSGMAVSVTLEKTGEPATREGCREFLRQVPQNQIKQIPGKAKIKDVKSSSANDKSFLEYTLEEAQGIPLNQRYVRLCIPREDVYIDFSLSKVKFQRGEENLYTSILDTVRIQ